MGPSLSCPECRSRMEEGFILEQRGSYERSPDEWIAGAPEGSFWKGTRTRGKKRLRVTTYRCEGCGYLKSYALGVPRSG